MSTDTPEAKTSTPMVTVAILVTPADRPRDWIYPYIISSMAAAFPAVFQSVLRFADIREGLKGHSSVTRANMPASCLAKNSHLTV